ncbi:hypothetical protein HGRIS_007807 [Hohenbuehelia grisea]|uniref:DH domain-containing protein n=1 Tax=Hohenbuehelia grisea TaxID=104357 RepID=A0ABR3J609_9AGAR
MNSAALDSNLNNAEQTHPTVLTPDLEQPPQYVKLPAKTFDPLSPTGLDPGALTLPLTPTTPISPSDPAADAVKGKKTNPLTDLIETEKNYVDLLTGIIRKVAAAWSRTNLPPPDLDTMFRSIESVYKANRSLLMKLKEIGTTPSSPKALGDLLMRWIDDLESPYTAYCTKYRSGFDVWDPVRTNARLPAVVSTFSAANPPPPSTPNLDPSNPSLWTLDALFLLPKARLKYYKKLYSRLLKSTTPGRSDHRLLVGALEKLDMLLETVENREALKVGEEAPVIETEDEIVIGPGVGAADEVERVTTPPKPEPDLALSSESSPAGGSSVLGERLSQETATSISRTSTQTMKMPISDLERRLSTHRTLDIFTMKPKVVRLQMSPPSLTFTREMRFSIDVVVRFTPRSTKTEVVHHQGHLFLLSDLFLICERMTTDEKIQNNGADMWLCYPPLAGKVLRVSEVPGQDNALQVAIMRKETLIIETESVHVRNYMMSELKECIEFAGSVSPPSKQPPPPMPPLNGVHQASALPIAHPSASAPSVVIPGMVMHPGPNSGMQHLESSRAVDGLNGSQNLPPQRMSSLTNNMSQSRFSDVPNRMMSPDRGPLVRHPMPSMYPPARSSSTQPLPPPGPGSNLARSTSAGPPSQHPHSLPSSPMYNTPPGQFGLPGSPNQRGPPPPHLHPHQPGQPGPSPNIPGPRGTYSPNVYQSPVNGQLPHGMQPPGSLPPQSGRVSAEPMLQGSIRKSPSVKSLGSQYDPQQPLPPVPAFPGGIPPNTNFLPRSTSQGSLHAPQPRSVLPSLHGSSRAPSVVDSSFADPSPPGSPVEETRQPTGPVTSKISAEQKCKVFFQQQHAQWKALGSARLKLYRQDPTNIKQLVVKSEKDKGVMISTIVLTDGVERVGKTGVAIELSDNGSRTGIIYMIQCQNESKAEVLFTRLLEGSDRAGKR